MDFSILNDRQKEAVLYINGPLLILAGPGSGKTRVLTYKIAHLVKEGHALPNEILAITFTNKAAKEMKERVLNLIGNDVYNIQISTFHSFGLRILKENNSLLSLDKNFTILDESDSISVIKKILKEMNLDDKQYNPKNIKYKISSAKNEIISSEDYKKYTKGDIDDNIAKIYKKYQEKLVKTSCVDFDDLLMKPIILFRNHTNILKQYQKQFKYVFIDEYQDTNEAQYVLSKMISAKYKNICVVGDESQNVYSWRGANYKNILNFEKDYPNAHTVLLEQNYRSTKIILDAANNVIKNNVERKDKNLFTENETGDKIKYYKAYDEKDEAMKIVNEIKGLRKDIDYDEMVVLYRTNAQSQIIERTFLENKIPYKIVGSYAYYNRKEIKDLVAYLKLINNLKDEVSLMRVINVPKRGIGSKTIENLAKKAEIEGKSLFDVLDDKKLLDFKNMILEIREESLKSTLTELIDIIFEKTKIKEEYSKEDSIEGDSKADNLEEFKSITRNFEESSGVVSLEDFLMEVSLISDINENRDEEKRVTLMTTHAVKGLEFKVVFIAGLEEGLFPHSNSLIDNKALEEERRLFYVAVTRAKKLLYFINARTRMLFGRTSMNMSSRFIEEIDSDYIDSNVKEEKKIKKIDKKKLFNEDDINYKVGDHVIHDTFNEGIVVSVDKNIITIAFPHKYGIKKMMKNHKSIKKI